MDEYKDNYKMFASYIYRDISKYIEDNKSDFEDWKKSQQKKEKKDAKE